MSQFRPPSVSYRLTAEGKLEPVKPEELLDNFVSVNILAIYLIKQKRLYVWIGENAPRELRNQIPIIEHTILKNHPLFTILRHFTLEGFRPETEELLDNLRISIEDYKKRTTEFAQFQEQTAAKLKEAKEKAQEAFKAEKFDDAINYANEVIDLSEKLFDQITRQEMEKFIKNSLEKQNRTKELRIQNKAQSLAKEFQAKVDHKEFDAAKQILGEIQAVVATSGDRGLKRKWEVETPQELEIQEKAYLAEQEKRLSQEEAIIAANFSEAKTELDKALKKEDIPAAKAQLKRLQQLSEKTKDAASKDSYKKTCEAIGDRINKTEQAIQVRSELEKKISETERIIASGDLLEAKQRLNEYQEIAETNGIVELVKKINELQEKIEKESEALGNQEQQVSQLTEKIELDEEQQNWAAAVDDCDQIIALLINLKKEKLLEEYSKRRENFAAKATEAAHNVAQNKKLEEEAGEDQQTLTEIEESFKAMEQAITDQNFSKARDEHEKVLAGLAKFHSQEKRDGCQTKANELYQKIAGAETAAGDQQVLSEVEGTFKEIDQAVEKQNFAEAQAQLTKAKTAAEKIQNSATREETIAKIDQRALQIQEAETKAAEAKKAQEEAQALAAAKAAEDALVAEIDGLLTQLQQNTANKKFEDNLPLQDQISAKLANLQTEEKKTQYTQKYDDAIKQMKNAQDAAVQEQMEKEDQALAGELDGKIASIKAAIAQGDLDTAQQQLRIIEPEIKKFHAQEPKGHYKSQLGLIGEILTERAATANTIKAELPEIRTLIDNNELSQAAEKIARRQDQAKANELEPLSKDLAELQAQLTAKQNELTATEAEIVQLDKEITQAQAAGKWDEGIAKCQQITPLLSKVKKDPEIPKYRDLEQQMGQRKREEEQTHAQAADQAERQQKIAQLQEDVKAAIAKEDYTTARNLNQNIAEIKEGLIIQQVKATAESVIKENEHAIEKGEQRQAAMEKVGGLLKSTEDAIKAGELEKAESNLVEAERIVKEYNLEKLQPNVEKTAEWLKREQLYARLCQAVAKNDAEGQYRAGIENCQQILKLIPEFGKDTDTPKYQELLAKFQAMQEAANAKAAEEHAAVQRGLEEFQQVMSVEQDIMPEVESIPLDDILSSSSSSLDQMMEALDKALQENRAEFKTEAKSSAVIYSASGEVMEIEKKTQIENAAPAADDPDKAKKAVKFNLMSALDNPFDDPIREAILEDIIPYNFEINEMMFDGQATHGEPVKEMTKEGLSVKWKLNDIPPKEKIKINYDLRQRVSRTAIIPLKDQLKILKTHANLNPLALPGLYDSKLTFKNEFQQPIRGMVFEDIIPQLYVYEVKRPEDEEHLKAENVAGVSVKWNMQKVAPDTKAVHQYQLLELYKFEELKMQVQKMDAEAFQEVQKCDAETSGAKFQAIVDLINSYLK
jgi:hypothetical protein